MGFSNALERRSSPENPSTDLSKPAAWLYDALGATQSTAGVRVSEESAMRFSAVFACVRVIAETLAYLPLPVYKRLAKGKERAPDHPLYRLLHDEPNPELTSFNWRELMQTHLLLWGNAWAEKEEMKSGKVTALWPLMPNKTRAVRRGGRKLVVTVLPDGREQTFAADEVLHIPGMGFNGLMGFSPIRMAMGAVGLGIAAEEFGARFYGQGATLAGVLTHEGNLTQPAQDRLRASFDKVHSGVSNSHRLLILEEAMKYEKIGIPPEEAQFLQLRKFQVNEICRMYRVPPHMVADIDRPFQSNVEQMGLDFIRYAMGPWLVRWEQILNRDLFSDLERGELFAEFLVNGLMRGDSAARSTFYQAMFGMGVYSQNDIREMENENPIENGDERFVPMNLIPLKMALEGPPEPDPETPPEDEPEDEPEAEQNREARAVVERRARGLAMRGRIMKAHQRLFLDAANRIIRHEVETARAAVKKAGATDDFAATLRRWMEGFYPKHREFVARQVGPVVEAMGSAVWAASATEIGADAEMTSDAEKLLNDYTESLAANHVGRSQGQIEGILNAYGTDTEIRESIEMRLGEWSEKRADKLASYETVKLGSAVARAMWLAAGVSVLRWASSQGACPICQEMDGRVVSIDKAFVAEGEHVGELVTRKEFAHPPLHEGCTCGITPG